MPFALIPFLLLAIPILEIAVFILVGNAIGLWPTLGLVILTAVIGSILLKQQGLWTLARSQAEIGAGRVPGRDLVSGVMIAMAGVLLLTPGLVTDALGFLLFVPFLVIDLAVSNLLLALGMHMVAPAHIALPLKLLLFVVIDGWKLLLQGLVLGYS